MIGNIALTMFFVFLNGFFVAAEFAIVKVRSSQIELRARDGNVLAGMAKHILSHLDAYLSASQLGITLASLGLGWIGEPVVGKMVLDVAAFFGLTLHTESLHAISVVIAFSIITVLHIVIGEMAPKTLAIRRSEMVALAVAAPMRLFFIIFRPVIVSLNWMSILVLKIFSIEHIREHDVHSPDELRYLIAESGEKGALEVSERELIENVFEFTETTAAQVMVPRQQIVAVEISMPVDKMLDYVMDQGYSRLPAYRNSIDNIVGIVYAKDLLTLVHHKNLIIIHDILHPAYFVQEDVMLKKLLRDMQQRKQHIAIVLDEFGGTAGLLTLEDIIEELVGTIQDEYDDEKPLFKSQSVDTWEFDASINIHDANDALPMALPENENYDTLGGLINAKIGRIASVGETVSIDNYNIHVLESTTRRVERVRITLQSSKSNEEPLNP
jgi:CBS domain containing-hemolysin-like protein